MVSTPTMKSKVGSLKKWPSHYLTCALKTKKRLKIARFNDPNIAPYIYEKYLYAYRNFPNNNEVLQYFFRMLFAQFREHMDPNYTDNGSKFYGVRKGRTYERPDAM